MRGMRLLLVASVVGAGACSSGSGDAAVTTTTVPPTVLTTQPPSTPTSPATLSTTSSTVAQVPRPSPLEAATALLDAWRAADRIAALSVADLVAVDTMFFIPVQPAESRGCNQGATDPTYCVYRLEAGELQLKVGKAGEGWLVRGVILGT
jgi:hypothetical protein